MSLTSPLGLMRHLRKPNLRLELVPWLNVMLLGLMLYLLSSSYIWAPGLVVSNSSTATLPKKINLPTLSVKPGAADFVGQPDAVLVIIKQPSQPSQFILNNGSYTLEELPLALKKLRQSLPGKTPQLMVKGDADMTLGTLMKVCAMAKEAGFNSELWPYMPAGSAPASGSASLAP
jgi:biopolymer transport protein ExbD